MTARLIRLIDQTSNEVARLNVALVGDLYRGSIDLDGTPAHLRRLFEEFEEAVEGQMFSIADEIEQKIGEIPLRVIFANGREAVVDDLQVFPSTNRISFKSREESKIAT